MPGHRDFSNMSRTLHQPPKRRGINGGEQCVKMAPKSSTFRLRLSPAALPRQRARGQLRQFWRQADDMFFRLDVNTGLYDLVNPAAERIFGWPLDQIRSIPFFIFKTTHPDELDWVRAAATRAMASGDLPQELEVVRAVRADGAEVFVQQKAWALRDRDGCVTHIEGVVRDVTDLVLARRDMERLLDRLPGLVVRLDENLAVAWANQEWLALHGVGLEPIRGRDGVGLMATPDCQDEMRAQLAGLGPIGQAASRAIIAPPGLEAPRVIQWRHVGLPASQGRRGVLSLGQDISDHMQVQRELVRTSADLARVASLLDRSPVMASRSRWTRRDRLEVEYVNQGCQALLGYSPEEIKADPEITRRILPDPWHQHYHQTTARFLASAQPGDSITTEYGFVRKDGSQGWARHTAWVVSAGGESLEVEAFIHDITPLHQAQETLRQMAAGMAHNFNNLMAAVLGNTQAVQAMLAEDRWDPAQAADLLANVSESARSGGQLVQRLAAWTNTGPAPLDDSEPVVDAAQEARRAVRIAAQAWRPAGGGQVGLELDLAEPLWVRANQGALLEVFLNLAKNALEAMPGGGKLAVWGEAQAGRVLIHFRDQGAGLAPETAARAFEPFFSTKRGSGLGLPSSRGILRALGGELRLETGRPQGCEAVVELPRASAPAPVDPGPTPLAQPMGTRVLLVEDEGLVALGIQSQLTSAGYQVRWARDLAEGLAALAQERPQAVICDLGLPDGSGWEVARAADRLRPSPAFLLLTGWTKDLLPAEVRPGSLRLDAILYKPVERGRLLEALAQALARSQGPARA